MRFGEKTAHFACFSLFSEAEIIFPIWINNLLNEYFLLNFELNIELNHFLARFNVKMNNQNVSATPSLIGEQYNVKIINSTTTTTMTLGWVVQGLNIVHFQAFLHLG